jgi:acyl dehydratase
MTEQIYWEDIEKGTEVTILEKVATTQMLVKWAGASGDFNPLHYDRHFTEITGIGQPIVQGALKRQWLIQLITDWMGAEGRLKKFSCRYRTVDYPRPMKTINEPEKGETWLCKGSVIKKYVEDNEYLVDCHIRLENGKGETTTTGKATILLPTRNRL